MRKIWTLLTLFIVTVAMLSNDATAQTRYKEQVFTDVTITQNIVYGQNYTVLSVPVTGSTTRQPLLMDFYEPTGDTEAERPLVLLVHTGNFLPNPENGSTGGTMRDSFIVEVATRLAKMGYAVAVPDYRLGWNPLSPSQEVRAEGLIQAAYRGVQDMRSCIRFFKMDYSTMGNTYSVDTSRITLFGQGTGGYISLATAALSEYQEVLLPKFINSSGQPMVIESIHGDIYGTSFGAFGTDTLCVPNHVGYSSDFQLCVNVGGALGDTSWMDAGEVPMISFQTTKDPFAPYGEDILIVPTTGDGIVVVQGASIVQARANELGNNDIFVNGGYTDPYSIQSNNINGGLEGLYPFYTPPISGGLEEGAPWEWWSAAYWSNFPHPSCPVGAPLSACNFHVINSINNPNMSKTKAVAYIDTIIGYFAPRACNALALGCSTVSAKDINSQPDAQLTIAPNPANEQVRIATVNGQAILAIDLFDINGRLVQSHQSLNDAQFDLRRNGLAAGFYMARVQLEAGVVTKKIIFE